MAFIDKVVEGGLTGVGNVILNAISQFHMSPEQQAEMSLKVTQAAQDYIKAFLADVQSAREMQIQTKSKTPGILSYFTLIAFAGCFTTLLVVHLDPTQLAVVATMTGMLGMMVKDVYGYWFGGSPTDEQQAQNIATLQKQLLSVHSQAIDNLSDPNVNLPK